MTKVDFPEECFDFELCDLDWKPDYDSWWF